MGLKLIKTTGNIESSEEEYVKLNKFCEANGLDLVFEWMHGQFWLHSDLPKERPIGIEIDRELTRHEEFFKKSSLHKELLAKALGVKGPYRPRVVDLTAGILGDSLMMLAFGCDVMAIERHPVMAFLIRSALKNAQHPRLKNFHFKSTDALTYLASDQSYESLYFDPMFEDANEKTSPRKEMRIFRSLVGKDQDVQEVFKKARSQNYKRLVVKRPRLSVDLGEEPSVQYIGKSTRYDVYFSV